MTCFVVDDRVAFDAGSLAMAATDLQRSQIRDIVLTHAHLDHIAGLPLFIDDLFPVLREPIRVHASKAVIDTLESDVFNWSIYPRFSELTNENGKVAEYRPIEPFTDHNVAHLTVRALEVNHKVPSTGFLISDSRTTIALTGDTAEMTDFWESVGKVPRVSAILIECAFPDELAELAEISHHLTPARLRTEMDKCTRNDCRKFVINLKPMYRERIVRQLGELDIPGLEILEVGKAYEF